MQFYTVDEVATALKVSRRTVQRAIKNEDLTGAKVGKLWRFSVEDIHAWIYASNSPNNSQEDDD